MRNKTMLLGVGVGVVIGLLLAATGIVLAGSLIPTAGPTVAGSQMYTLQQIYDRLDHGAAATKMMTFTEPTSGPTAGTSRTLDEIMAKAPALDATNGAGAAHVTSGKTFWGLTAGAWGLQTGTASGGGSTYNAGVPKTGQTTSNTPRDDGDLQKGVAWPTLRFTNNSNGTVTDNLTGLIWLTNANCFDMQTWATAIISATALANGDCGLTDGSVAGDWRLPNVRELHSLVHYGFSNPAVPNTAGTGKWDEGSPFTGVQSSEYWTSTAYTNAPSNAWNVNLDDGYVFFNDETGSYHAWPVRGGQ